MAQCLAVGRTVILGCTTGCFTHDRHLAGWVLTVKMSCTRLPLVNILRLRIGYYGSRLRFRAFTSVASCVPICEASQRSHSSDPWWPPAMHDAEAGWRCSYDYGHVVSLLL